MTTPTAIPAADRRRAASILLSCLNEDAETFDATLAEACNDPGGLPGMLGALVSGTLELLVGAAGGVDNARMHLNLQILNAEADDD